jgi:hypothetical protein
MSPDPSIPLLIPYEGMRLWCDSTELAEVIHNGVEPFEQCTDVPISRDRE